MLAGETIERESAVEGVIDDGLLRFRGRTLVSGTEVVDFLLDLRLAVDAETRLGTLLGPVASQVERRDS